jgi:hypothetical protein
MRNGFLCVLLLFYLGAVPVSAQTEAPSFVPGLTPWQPPRTDEGDRPNVGPRGYPVYGQVDYLLWWTEKDRPIHPVLPQASDFGPQLRNGARGTIGYWLDEQQHYAVEVGGFWTLERSLTANGQGANLGWRTEFVSRLGGAETQVRGQLYRGTWANADLLGGFRFLSLDEGLNVFGRQANAITFDGLGAHNRFYGGQLGAEIEFHYDKWFADLWGKAALGGDFQDVRLGRGELHRTAFAVVPEVGVNTGYQLTNTIRLSVGYTFFYLSDAARPGNQLPSARPPVVQSGAFWGQGLNFGVTFRF